MVAKPTNVKRIREKIPRLVLDLSDEQKTAFSALCDAIFPGARASYSHVLRRLIGDACEKHKIQWPESDAR